MLSAFCARAYFRPQEVEGLGHRHVESPSIAGSAIQLALDRKELRTWLEAVTACGSLSNIEGRVVQTRPGAQRYPRQH